MMKQEIKDILEREFLPEDIAKDYNNNDYVKPHLVIARLNEAFGPGGWQFEVMERIEDVEYVIQYARLGVKGEDGEWIWKENCGGMTRTYKTGTPHEPKNEINYVTTYKGAVSNCLKRCAMMWGVGLHLYGDPEHEGEDPREVSLENIANGERTLSKKLECEANDLRNDHFADGADNLDAMSLEELEGYLVFLRGLRDAEKQGEQSPTEGGEPSTDTPPADVAQLKFKASQIKAKALANGVNKLDVDAIGIKHFGTKSFSNDAGQLAAYIDELGKVIDGGQADGQS